MRSSSRKEIPTAARARYSNTHTARPLPKMLLPTLAWDERFRVENAEDVMTPALLLYPDAVAANIDAIVKSLSGDAGRWRAHVKTAKLAFTMRMLVERGVANFKCATTLE